MSGSPMVWKKGRGKLGGFDPLIGRWRAEADSEMGKVVCTRTFTRVAERHRYGGGLTSEQVGIHYTRPTRLAEAGILNMDLLPKKIGATEPEMG